MRDYKEYTVLDAKATTGIDKTIDVGDFRHIVISFASAFSANLTVKFQGGIDETAPTFTGAQTVANHWDYIQIKDLEDGSTLDGDVGVALTGTDDFRTFEANTNGLKWFTANVTAYTAGNVTIKVRLFND